ncbi:sodium ion-translocating decarboxylase subunit beta [Natronincola ferrireducens]|uniref:Na+-transporting oxaloacetate decarboxylase beta subunit n=1 Tax=Natronincola ferrireducens TaxID=393762 RepID=A0A1G9GZV1_9FIRM|nr:sodium ion-translocating decarboxylase subunit beta [Natronincola ferrireducens]SDL06181.1 Na+-transporting oxaloacetate decarboxylase beta subunit [Natronincola ferrireducens]
MKKLFSKWSFSKHLLLCLIIIFIARIVARFTTSPNHASSIGIIGGADGPTEIYLSGDTYSAIIGISVLILLLALYKPLKMIIKKL